MGISNIVNLLQDLTKELVIMLTGLLRKQH